MDKILVVDDEENVRLILQQVFSDYPVITATEGETALRLIASERPAVVLLDMKMPSMGGLQVLAALKTLPYRPIIFMLTGEDDLDTAVKTLELGARGYLTKPFDVDQLRNVVLSALVEREKDKTILDKPWTVIKKDG